MIKKLKIAVAMSGGVDSTVAAFLLKKAGHDLVAFFMKNWEDALSKCSSQKDFEDVVRVCGKLDIPYYSFNFSKNYKEKVFQSFLEGYKKGHTPNPDILCNKEIKFKLLLEKANLLGADFLATGHYSRIAIIQDLRCLMKGSDLSKDQSYFLYTLKEDLLKKILFPVGDMEKKQLRKVAKENDLCTYDKKDSTGICFIGERNFNAFLSEYLPPKKGDIISVDGKKIGEHIGAHFYTIGQRKGLKIGGSGNAWFVSSKDIDNNVVYVCQGQNHPALFKQELIADEVTWVNEKPSFPFRCAAKIRYRQSDQPCTVKCRGNENSEVLHVKFDSPQRAITEKQSVVFYQENICLGGGIIQKGYNESKTL